MDAQVMIWSTAANPAEADAIARALVAERLAACVHTHPVASTYRWQGAVETAAEVALVAKTTAALADAVAARIAALHSYAAPEILVTPITGGSPAYRAWLAESVADPAQG